MTKTNTPNEKVIDDTLALLQEGYLFIKNRTDKYQSDLFQTTLLGQEVICITGKEAAEIFYDTERFVRSGVAPKRIQKTLTGENTIQGMDGEAHYHRKAFFMSLTTNQHPEILADLVYKEWVAVIPRWETAEKIKLFDEAKIVLCKAACKWAGVPLLESETKKRADDFTEMIDSFEAVGPRHWKGRIARPEMEKWMQNIIDNVRAGRLVVPQESALYTAANYKELDGNVLESNMAAKELINIIRPIIAISFNITFLAMALYEHPECLNMLTSDADAPYLFVQEVRRFYPFTPFVAAKVKKDFVWKNFEFKTGTLVLLDIYGIDHDSRIWDKPYEFQPERFRNWQYDPFEFVPHGGGDPAGGHRCPGESITVEIMKATLNFLINRIKYKVPDQNLSYCMARIPAMPKSGFIINNVKSK